MSEKPYPLAIRMKEYEFEETEEKFNDDLPLICRVDGRSFSKFCKQYKKPYSDIISSVMKETACFLLKETKADLSYHQSDEISLLFNPVEFPKQRMFNGSKTKLISVISGLTSAFFMKSLIEISNKNEQTIGNSIPHFDSRMFSVPNMTEAGNYFVWRQQDAKRNSISMYAQSIFSHKLLQNKSGKEMLKMIEEAGHDYNSMPFNFKYGSFFMKESVEKEIDGNKCIRTEVKEYDIDTITYSLLNK